MNKEELQKAWQEVQDRLNLPSLHIHETVLQYLEEKNNELRTMLVGVPVSADKHKGKNK